MRIKSRHFLRDDVAKKIINQLVNIFGSEIAKFFEGKQLELAETDEQSKFVLVDGEPLIFLFEDQPFLTLKGALKLKPKKRRVVIDMGAVKFISKGADIMCPGIVDADLDIQKGDLVIVVDEVHGKPLAIGRALISGDEMMSDRGKAIKSMHYVGDRIWRMEI
ncbi:MAG: RNA-binding protein [Methanocellales archaeon]